MEAASGFEPESRGFAEDDRPPEGLDRVRPTRLAPHHNKTLRESYPTTTRAWSKPSRLVWGKDGASAEASRCTQEEPKVAVRDESTFEPKGWG